VAEEKKVEEDKKVEEEKVEEAKLSPEEEEMKESLQDETVAFLNHLCEEETVQQGLNISVHKDAIIYLVEAISFSSK
jgi:hypothetical protein